MAIRDQLKSFKKEKVMQEAQRLFFKRGFRGTSLEAIASSMGMTKPFIYGLYENKAKILFDISLRNIKLALDAVESACQAAGTPSERLVEVARRLTHICIEHGEAVTVFFREEASLEPLHLKTINELKGQLDSALAGLLEEGVESGDFKMTDVRIGSLAISGMISWSYTWYRPTGRLKAEEIKEHMAQYSLLIAGARL
jgi:AcrR family transcriptional regulator